MSNVHSHTLIAIDPGSTTGLAILLDGRLVRAEALDGHAGTILRPDCPLCRVEACSHALQRELRLARLIIASVGVMRPDLVVVERPAYWRSAKIDPGQIMGLSLLAGVLVGGLLGPGWPMVLGYRPDEWKGQLPKDQHQPHILACLQDDELLRVPRGASYYQPDVVDAVGLALFAAGRLGKWRINPLHFASAVAPAPRRNKKKAKPLTQGGLALFSNEKKR